MAGLRQADYPAIADEEIPDGLVWDSISGRNETVTKLGLCLMPWAEHKQLHFGTIVLLLTLYLLMRWMNEEWDVTSFW